MKENDLGGHEQREKKKGVENEVEVKKEKGGVEIEDGEEAKEKDEKKEGKRMK